MRRLAAAAVFAMACGAMPPAPLPVVQPVPGRPAVRPTRPSLVHVAPPPMAVAGAIQGPDLSEEPRWPLTVMDHPRLAPHHDVAGVLADPGIAWTELCARGVHERRDPSHRDELAYLSGWCAAEHHDLRGAVSALAPLLHSVVPEIENAVPYDLANILVESQDAEHAEQLLSDEGLRDPRLWDVLAASYFEVGKNTDALRATSTALQLAPTAAPSATCHRLAREILLGSDAMRELVRPQLEALASGMAPDPICAELAASITCALDPATGCHRYFDLKQVDPGLAAVWALHETWSQPRDWSAWIDIAWRAQRVEHSSPIAIEMLLQALDAAIAAGDCKDQPMHAIVTATDAMTFGAADRRLQIEALLVRGLVGHPEECAAYRDRWLAANPQ